jgi:anti-sigma factor RsiW
VTRTRNPVCWLIRRRLGAYQDGELTAGRRQRVERHVGQCEACRGELAGLGRLRAALALDVAEPPEGMWVAFWPQVRARIATTPSASADPAWRRIREVVPLRRRLALAPALAAGALAVVAVVAPWQRVPQETPTSGPTAPVAQLAALDEVVIQSIETEDPDVPVMVYASPDSDVTVLWVFGLEPTGV